MISASNLPVLVPNHVDEILDELCMYLQITRAQFEKAVSSYSAVRDWLNAPGSSLAAYSPRIYPQGSMAILTTARPVVGDEFDVDLVCQLHFWLGASKDLYEAVGRRLNEHETYRRILARKNRCWRLNYAGDFHLDVLPGRPDVRIGGTAIEVPDRSLNEWKPSNPLGFAAWFNGRVGLRRLHEAFLTKMPPLPEPDPFVAPEPLRKTVLLLKRRRDVRFEDNPDHAPRSIVLTTLAGNYYNGQASTAESLLWILSGISAEIQRTPGVMAVLNPANQAENFAEKWAQDPLAYAKFVRFIDEFASDVRSMLTKPIAGGLADDLEKLFGKKAALYALNRYAEKLEAARGEHRLRYSPALGLTTSMAGTKPYKTNTNFGSTR